MSRAASRRIEVSPAALGSIGLHVAVAAAFMVSWGAHDLKVGSVTPVTIVSTAPSTDVRPAIQGPETVEAATEEPAPEAPPEPTPPPPTPAPPTPTPTPKATKPIEKAAPPTKSATKPAEKSFDLDALSASLTRPARNAPQRPSAAPKGPTRAETAPIARQTAGTGLSTGAALEGLAEDLQRRWNPNCSLSARNVVVKTTFQLGIGGNVMGEVLTQVQDQTVRRGQMECTNANTRECIVQSAADRAAAAVHAAAPFRGLPRELYGQRIVVNFNAREACA